MKALFLIATAVSRTACAVARASRRVAVVILDTAAAIKNNVFNHLRPLLHFVVRRSCARDTSAARGLTNPLSYGMVLLKWRLFLMDGLFENRTGALPLFCLK